MIRLVLPAGLALAGFLAVPESTVLVTDYARQATWTVNSERSFNLETLEMSIEVDGVPMERGGMGGGGTEDVRTVAQSIEVLEHVEGVPTAVRRTFADVEGTSVMRFGEEEIEEQLESPFEGAEFDLRLEEDGVVIEVTEGDIEADDLDAFGLTLALDGLLPGDGVEVKVDATWDVDGAKFLRALGLDVAATLFPRAPREESEGGRGRGRNRSGGSSGTGALLDLEWEVEVTLVSLSDDHDLGQVARLVFEAEGTGDAPAREGRGGRGGEASTEGGVSASFEGELLFLLVESYPVALTCSGTVGVETITTRSRERGDIVIRNVQDGEFALAIEVGLVPSDDGDD